MDRWNDVTFTEAVCLMSLDGQIVWVNDLFTELLGFTLEEMLARPRFSLLDPDDAAVIADSLPQTFETQRSTPPLRLFLATKAGESIVASITVRPDLDGADGEEPVLVISVRPAENHWESVITALAGDSPIDATVQSIADALGHHDVSVVLSIGTDDGRRQFRPDIVPPEVMPAVARLDDLLDREPDRVDGARDGTVIAWDEVPDLTDDDLEMLRRHDSGVAVVTPVDDPSGLGDARYIFLFASPSHSMRIRWMTAHRPQEYFSLALLARHRRRELVHAATHDPLTGLPNRARFFTRITELGTGPVGLLFVDLDGFKPINDEYGHSAGDLVLIEVARRLRSCVRPDDLAARVGGDEFGVVCGQSIGVDELTGLADRLVRQVAEPIMIGEGTVRVGASVGVALGHPMDSTALVDAADAAMYEAKTSGKSRWSMTQL